MTAKYKFKGDHDSVIFYRNNIKKWVLLLYKINRYYRDILEHMQRQAN